MPFPRLTWVGLLIATLGWALLLSYTLIAPAVGASWGGEIYDPDRFILIFGENAVITGLAIAVLGALERALKLLGRIAGNASQIRPPAKSNAPAMTLPTLHSAPPPAPAASPTPPPPMLMPQRNPGDVVTRGALNGRDYVLFRDGSAVVETLLGPRRFPSITDAQEFIGAN